MKISVYNIDGKKLEAFEAAKKWDEIKFAKQAVKDSVVYAMANKRRGTAKAKNRSEINFTTKKPWNQKGTGRARAGTASSPIWRKGGVVFGPKPRDFAIGLPKKVRRLALTSALGEKVRNNEVVIIDKIKIDKPKTKVALEWLKKIESTDKPLIVMKDNDRNVQLSIRNIQGTEFSRAGDLNTYIIMKHKKMVIEKDAWDLIEKEILGVKKQKGKI